MHDVVPKSLGLETTFKASNFPTSPVCDRRVSNYERILPKEDLENVHRLLQTPTPRRRRTAGIHVKDSFTSPTADQFSPVSLPASILKTRRERRHENTSADVTESQFKSLRFDLPNSFVSNCDSIISNTNQLKERECKDDPLETNYADALDAPNPDGLEFTDMNKEVFLEKHLELEDELKTLVKKDERTEYTSTTSQESPHKISVEEQSDSDIVEEQEVNGLHDKTEPSLMINENSLIQKSTAPVSVSYEEQEDPGIPLDEDTHNINSDVCVEDKQSIYSAGSLPESTSVLTTKISRHSATFGIKISSEPPKKRSDSLIDEIAAEWEGNIASADNIGSTVSESLQKKISYEQEDESDPTSTEIEKAVVCDPETKLASTWRKLEGQEGVQEIVLKQALSVTKSNFFCCTALYINSEDCGYRYQKNFQCDFQDVEVEFSGSVNLPPRRSRPKQEDAVGQAVRTFSSDSFHSSDSDSEISTLSHRMLTRSAAKDNSLILTAKLVSLSPEVQTTLRKRLESGSSLTHSRETTPRRLTRAISSAKSSSRTEKTRRKRPKSRTSSPCNLETTPKRLTRTTYSSKSPSKTEEIRRKRSEKSRTSLTHSREVTPQRSTRPVSAKNSPTRKSLRSRTQSEQIEAKETIPTVTPKASPNRRRRAASEESQLNKTSTPSHPMLTRSARKAKSENGSPPKQRTMSGFEPSLAKIDGLFDALIMSHWFDFTQLKQ
ncbi:hypothetical protein WUBG_03895 [Wuchereria bancrofti]|uniref:Uncharacterized protein n=1 Tax=Wuchereria bancrofti TaxID=6293 RepID=J9BDE1_WUCBA|nr:hypothetical protein WUBG_03895 [Wuchereria bancrofti]